MSSAADHRWKVPDPENELRFLFENAPFGVAHCSRSGAIYGINPTLEQMLGRNSAATRNLHLAELIPSEDKADFERSLRDLFEGERTNFQTDSTTTSPEARPVRWTAWQVGASNRRPDYVLAIVEEASPDDQVRERLRQAERLEAVGRLAGGVAHDFNNLLTGVLLYCDLLLSGLEAGHPVRKYAQEIRGAGVQATGLIKQLLAAARPGGTESCLLSLNDIVGGMRDLLVRLIGESIELDFRLDPKLGLVKLSPVQAQQILLNLVLNARDAMPDGGQITVETSSCQVQVLDGPRSSGNAAAESREARSRTACLPCVRFMVGDNGKGMDATTRAHLFEPFFTTKGATQGTGLGLANVHEIVTSNGGLIHVDSAPECGTRITLLLPLAPQGIQPQPNLEAFPIRREPGDPSIQYKEEE
jgi:two-component system cell cycle sensor histidine kinase/response regulator CckA